MYVAISVPVPHIMNNYNVLLVLMLDYVTFDLLCFDYDICKNVACILALLFALITW